MIIGVLALQGDYLEHQRVISNLGIRAVLVKESRDFENLNGLIIPGGESTSMRCLSMRRNIWEILKVRLEGGLPVFGTCAGLVLLSKKVEGEDFPTLGVLDIIVRRNAYGRQKESWEEEIYVKSLGGSAIKGVFIRAPQIIETGPQIEILAKLEEMPVLVKEKNILAATFHPELIGEGRIHSFFLDMIKNTGR